MSEQRRFPRISFKESSGIETGHFETFEGAAACDLSSGGIRVRSQQFLALGSTLRIRFQIMNGQELVMSGKVAWVQKEPHGDYYQLGIEFQNDSSFDFNKRRLENCIEESFYLERSGRPCQLK